MYILAEENSKRRSNGIEEFFQRILRKRISSTLARYATQNSILSLFRIRNSPPAIILIKIDIEGRVNNLE